MKPRIVVLDGFTTNPGDISWDALYEQGDVVIYERTPRELTVERAKDADILLSNKTILDKEVLSKLPNLKYIGLMSTGTNIVDLKYCRERNIPVTNIPGYSTNSVAQMVFAFILEFFSGVKTHSDSVRNGMWSDCIDFSYTLFTLQELANKTIGIIGYGKIGRKVRDIAKAFSMNVLIHSRTKPADVKENEWATFEELLSKSDIVTLHCPLTEENRYMIDKKALSLMKPTSYLINTARGALINEEDLAEALTNGTIKGAGLDVMVSEPPKKDNPLLKLDNCLITPHIAWATKEARQRLLSILCGNIKAFLNGNPVNLV